MGASTGGSQCAGRYRCAAEPGRLQAGTARWRYFQIGCTFDATRPGGAAQTLPSSPDDGRRLVFSWSRISRRIRPCILLGLAGCLLLALAVVSTAYAAIVLGADTVP